MNCSFTYCIISLGGEVILHDIYCCNSFIFCCAGTYREYLKQKQNNQKKKLFIAARQPCNKKAVPTLVWAYLCRNSNTHPHIDVHTGGKQHLLRCVPCDVTHNFVRVQTFLKKSLCHWLAFVKSVHSHRYFGVKHQRIC